MKHFKLLRRVRRETLWRIAGIRYLGMPSDQAITFVTACDSTHYLSALQLIESIGQHEPNSRIVMYDLGLSEDQQFELDLLTRSFPEIEVRRFDYSQYPDFFNIKVAAGEYAWKPAIVNQVVNQVEGFVFWCDAGNKLTSRLVWIRKIVASDGIYCPNSDGVVKKWTHPKTLRFLAVDSTLWNKSNLNAALVCLDTTDPNVKKLTESWLACALQKDCIAPAGSSRANHRQDQAVLTVLYYKLGLERRKRSWHLNQLWEPTSIKIQQDVER